MILTVEGDRDFLHVLLVGDAEVSGCTDVGVHLTSVEEGVSNSLALDPVEGIPNCVTSLVGDFLVGNDSDRILSSNNLVTLSIEDGSIEGVTLLSNLEDDVQVTDLADRSNAFLLVTLDVLGAEVVDN